MRIIKIILLLIIIALIATFIFQNQAVFAQKFELGLDLKFYKIGPYLAMNFAIILVSFFAGGILALIWGAFHSISGKSQIRKRDKKIRELENQIQDLSTSSSSEQASSSVFSSSESS